MLRIENLGKSYGYRQVFQSLSFSLNDKEKVGVVGPNGVGKTTLLNIITGDDTDFEGRVQFDRKGTVFSYVKQDLTKEDFRHIDGWMELSGGMRTRQALKDAFEQQPDLMVLDEPNNHLDNERLEELEKRLILYGGTLLIVSHDRALLDSVCTHVLEVTENGCRKYVGNYSAYFAQKEMEARNQQQEYDKFQRERKNLRMEIVRRKEWYKSAHKAAGQNDFYRAKAKKQAAAFRRKEKALERLEAKDVRKPWEADRIRLQFIQPEKSAEVLLRVRNLEKSFGDHMLFSKGEFCILRGERYQLAGMNGTGKTTLLNLLSGKDEAFSGEIERNPYIKTAYYTQHHLDIDDERTVLETVRDKGLSEAEARTILGSFLIRGEHVFKQVGELSVGQKSKLALLCILLEKPDLLLLDEPVNHMDILSREKIEEALQSYEGTVIFVSHDRRFNEKLATRVLSIEANRILEYPGDFKYYREKKKTPVEREIQGDKEQEKMLVELQISRINGLLADPTMKKAEKEAMEKNFFQLCAQLKKINEALINK